MKDTLEEKIMGIQKFKLNVANAIINIDNASVANIKESNILNFFNNIEVSGKHAKSKCSAILNLKLLLLQKSLRHKLKKKKRIKI